MKFEKKRVSALAVTFFCVLSSGHAQVGIGTTSPSNALDIETSSSTTVIDLNNTAADGDPLINFQLGGASTFSLGVDDGDGDKFKIGTSAIGTNTRLTIDGNGDVGINDDDPAYKLEVGSGAINITVGTAATDYYMLNAQHALSQPNTNNLYIGALSGAQFNTGGTDNTFVGYNSGNANTTADGGTFVGSSAGAANTIGTKNVFVGQNAGLANTEGGWNVFIGQDAGQGNTTGEDNTFIGYDAGGACVTGIENTYVGADCGESFTGSYNAVLGSGAANGATSGEYNSVFGCFAGLNLSTGAENSYFGYYAGAQITSGSGNVCIGYRAGPVTANTSDNLLYIDNAADDTPLIYGDFANDRVGIGRVAATNALEVSGNASKDASGDWLANSDARLKKEITPMDSKDIIEKMMQLQGVTYYWNDTVTGSNRPEVLQYGFTAQNIEKVFPILVSEDSLGYLQTAYGTYDAMYVESIKYLYQNLNIANKQIERLTAELSETKNVSDELLELKEQIIQLQSLVVAKAP